MAIKNRTLVTPPDFARSKVLPFGTKRTSYVLLWERRHAKNSAERSPAMLQISTMPVIARASPITEVRYL